MNIEPSVRTLLLSIMRQFPEVAVCMKARARERRSVAFSTTIMLEEFACEAQRALIRGDAPQTRVYLSFMSNWLDKADALQHEFIDVYFVEGIILSLPSDKRRAMWTLMPQNLRDLHTRMWGSFDKMKSRS